MKPKTKRQRRDPDRTGGLPGQDRISGLPDALLCHILSFLQTIYAVKTCVLSRRWKNIWESVPTLDFDYGSFRKSLKLKTIADYVLSFRNSSNIKFLHVTVNRYSCNDSMAKIFSSCPVLEDLTIDYLKWRRYFIWTVSVLEVAAPAVKTLRIYCDNEYFCGKHCSINCPKLENLVLKGNPFKNYCLAQAESLVKASVELLHHCSNKDRCFSRFTSLVAGVSSVKYLYLSANCFEDTSVEQTQNLMNARSCDGLHQSLCRVV